MTADELRAELDYCHESGRFFRKVARGGQQVGDVAGYVNRSTGYVLIDVCGKTYAAHRLAWLHATGFWPVNDIDHINRQRADNRLANLRDVPRCENARNAPVRRTNTSGVAGVYWHRPSEKWLSLAFRFGKQRCLGYFSDWFEAVCARKSWEAQNQIGQ